MSAQKLAEVKISGWYDLTKYRGVHHLLPLRTLIVVYAPIEPTDGNSSDSVEFYIHVQEQRDRIPDRKYGIFSGGF